MGDTAITSISLRTGPFISGTTYAQLRLGQQPTATSEPEELNSSRTTDGAEMGGKGKTQVGKKGRGGTSLRDLVESGMLHAGRNKLTVVFKGITYTASLEGDGLIAYQGKQFNSPTAFSMHCKRLQAPQKQGDDGWKSVLYEGTQLDVFRRKYLATPAPVPQEKPVEKEGEVKEKAAEEAADADQWVQCERCRTWRVVPPEKWPSVEADEREDWLCEYATWELSKFAPFKPACGK